jgi:hypothetical protein
MIPRTFEEWTYCIVNDCGITLTPQFANERLSIYSDTSLEETKKFVALYGEVHRQNIITWLNQVLLS